MGNQNQVPQVPTDPSTQVPLDTQSPQGPMEEAQAASDAPAQEPTRVADAHSVAENGRIHVKVQDRYLSILRRNGQLFAIDSVCFHAGGPLGLGDIEEVNGQACLVCPWHYYKIDIKTGDKYYQQMKFVDKKLVAGDWVSNGVQQRCHKVWEADGGILVQLSAEPEKVASDQYASMPSCGDRVMTGKNQQGQNVGGTARSPQVRSSERHGKRHKAAHPVN